MDEEIKEVGEMATIEDEEDIAIEEDYTALEAETIIVDDDSNIQADAEYEQAVEQKELADEAREALSAVLLSVLEKGEINDDDIAEIAAQQEIYTENVTALKILGLTAEDGKSTAGKSTTNVITSNIEPGDILFWDSDNEFLDRFMACSHTSICVGKDSNGNNMMIEGDKDSIIRKIKITDRNVNNLLFVGRINLNK